MTEGDIARIAAHVGRDDFWSRRRPQDAEYLDEDPDDPAWQALTSDGEGRRAMLERRPQGDCTFLGARGCTLPLDVRPLVCRLYPFSYTERGLTGVEDGYCPREALLPRDEPGVTMLTVLGMEAREGERWRRQLYSELRSARGR